MALWAIAGTALFFALLATVKVALLERGSDGAAAGQSNKSGVSGRGSDGAAAGRGMDRFFMCAACGGHFLERERAPVDLCVRCQSRASFGTPRQPEEVI
jgi:hypothetical protein